MGVVSLSLKYQSTVYIDFCVEKFKIQPCQIVSWYFGSMSGGIFSFLPLKDMHSNVPLILGLLVSFPCLECLYDRIAQETVDETEIAQRLSKVNKYICEKIMDINKSCKNEERREAKYNLQ